MDSFFIDDAYIFAKKTSIWCIVSLYDNISIVLELWRVEGDRTDFNGDFKHKAERRSAVVNRYTVFSYFLTNE